MRSSLGNAAATRPARTWFLWPQADPGHLAPQGELQLIIMDSKIIIMAAKKNLHLLCHHSSSDKGQISTKISSPNGKEWSAITRPENTYNVTPEYLVPSFKYNPKCFCPSGHLPFSWPAHSHCFGNIFFFYTLINPLLVWLCSCGSSWYILGFLLMTLTKNPIPYNIFSQFLFHFIIM